MLEALGEAHNEHSVRQLMEATALSDAKHSVNCQHVVSYTRTHHPTESSPARTLYKLSHV